MAFTYKILTQNGVNNTNIDGARAEYFASGMRDGIVKGSLNECAFTVIPSNGINLDTGVLLIAGHPIVITEGRSWTFTSRPSNSERMAVIAEITVDNNSAVTFRVFEQLASISLVKNNMYEHENGSGTYQVEIGRFTLTTNGTIADMVRTIDVITGGSGGTGEHFVAGDMTTTMLDAGMDANVTAEDVYDANGNYKKTNFDFEFPETAGTVVKVNNIEQANLDFTSDPQTQLDNKLNKSDIDDALSSTSENPVQNKVITNALNNKADASDLSQYAKKNDATQAITTASITSNLTRTKGTESVIPTGDSYNNPSNELTKTVTSTGGTVNLQHGDLNVVTESGKTMKLNNNEVATTDILSNFTNLLSGVPSNNTSHTIQNISNYKYLILMGKFQTNDAPVWASTMYLTETIITEIPYGVQISTNDNTPVDYRYISLVINSSTSVTVICKNCEYFFLRGVN